MESKNSNLSDNSYIFYDLNNMKLGNGNVAKNISGKVDLKSQDSGKSKFSKVSELNQHLINYNKSKLI